MNGSNHTLGIGIKERRQKNKIFDHDTFRLGSYKGGVP